MNFLELELYNNLYILLLTTALIVFIVGLSGIFLTRKNIIMVLICIELLLLSINFFLVLFSIYLDDITGYFFAFFILTIGAAEASIGISILIVFYRLRQNISIDYLSGIKG